MKRRVFLLLSGAAAGYAFWGWGRRKEETWEVVDAVMNHLFPGDERFPSARRFAAVRYLKMNIHHPTFDPDDREMILSGAKRLEREHRFLSLSKAKREALFRRMQTHEEGRIWLATMLYYGLEAMLGDPIYGGNRMQSGWHALHHHPGRPRPTRRYGKYHA